VDEVLLTINGERHYLWRAVDQDDNVLDILGQSRRNKKAAKKFFRKLLKGLMYVPRVIITDKLKSYGAAKRKILPGVEHRQSRFSITDVRTRTGPRESVSDACKASSHPIMPSVFCQHTDPSLNTSGPVATCYERVRIAASWSNDLRNGGK
jgi:transposase-like protein